MKKIVFIALVLISGSGLLFSQTDEKAEVRHT